MFEMRSFIKFGLLDSIGIRPRYQVTLNAAGWFDKGVLTEADLEEIDAAIKARYGEVDRTIEKAEAFDVIIGDEHRKELMQ